MSTRISIQAFPFSELEKAIQPKAIAALKDAEVTEPLEILTSVFTKSGLLIPPAFLEDARNALKAA
jgi:hypothetical protein